MCEFRGRAAPGAADAAQETGAGHRRITNPINAESPRLQPPRNLASQPNEMTKSTRTAFYSALLATSLALGSRDLGAQSHLEARNRWERLCTIRREKFDRILPEAMRENQIDMWIVAMKEGHYDPLWELLGRGYVGSIGYYIFTDRGGDRIERAAIGITDHHRARLRRLRRRLHGRPRASSSPSGIRNASASTCPRRWGSLTDSHTRSTTTS